MKKVTKKSIYISEIETILLSLFYFLLLYIIHLLFQEYVFVYKLSILLFFVNLIYLLINLIFIPYFYKTYRYQVFEGKIFIKKGVFINKEINIPLNRIQHVELEQSFVSKTFNNYKVVFYTAGGNETIEFLNKEEGEKIKSGIITYLNSSYVEESVVLNEK